MPTATTLRDNGQCIFACAYPCIRSSLGAQKLLHQKLVVGGLYDCVVVAQQSLRSQVELVL